ncbi:MAG TPA: hypothetical protein VNU19_20470 [Candidatus Acidoferrum sp.]|jgi:hypothetical protein|nr:hypothetical protein [Candidatus Acidoferrum sp.]
MDADNAERWRAVEAGGLPLTWDLWSSDVRQSTVLTSAGRTAVVDAVEVIASFLGEDWLSRFLPLDRNKPGARGLPLLSFRWWPANDVPTTFDRLLTFAARLRLLAGSPGLVPVRKAVRGSLGNFEHSLLQLEVAALALRDGWRATFEPKPDPTGTRVTDLRLTRSGDSMLVEVKGFQLDDVVRADLRLAGIVSQAYLALQLEHDVYVSGDISSPTSRDELDGWLTTLGPLAAMVAQDQQPRQSQPPFGGLVEIRAGLPANGTQHSMPIRRRDEWARITAQIDAKAEQGRGAEPLWLRFEETGQFWSLAAPPDERLEWAESWAAALERRLSIHEHVAGLLLSGPDQAISRSRLQQAFQLERSSAAVLSCTTSSPFWRESLIVAGPHSSAIEQAEAWQRWYLNEDSWLAWAHGALGLAPPTKLFAASAH